MGSYHRKQTEEWLRDIDVKADSVLDIGGAQLPIKGRTKSWDVKEYKILDLYEPHEEKQKADIIDDIQGDVKCNERFDIIFCIEVSEYWFMPLEALSNINFLLKDNGILYITFPFVYGCHKPEGLDYLRYTPHGVEKLIVEAGFKILETRYRHAESGNKVLENFYNNEKMKILKNNFDHEIIGSMVKCEKI